MNGREFFSKYCVHINRLTRIIGLLPQKIRSRRFEALRYKNGSIAMFKRYLYFKTLTKQCGENVAIFPGVFFENIENLVVGSNVSIHQMCYIDAEGEIEIGDNVSIAHRSTILSSNHGYKDPIIPIKYQNMILEKTKICNNVWIGCGCVVLSGVEIGSGTVVGANSAVTKSIPENSVALGSPAKRIKSRLS